MDRLSTHLDYTSLRSLTKYCICRHCHLGFSGETLQTAVISLCFNGLFPLEIWGLDMRQFSLKSWCSETSLAALKHSLILLLLLLHLGAVIRRFKSVSLLRSQNLKKIVDSWNASFNVSSRTQSFVPFNGKWKGSQSLPQVNF